VPPDGLVNDDHSHLVEADLVGDQDPTSLGQDRVVRGVSRHAEGFGDVGDGQGLPHERNFHPRGTATLVPPTTRHDL
jgi:hypothetical protein